MGLFSRGELNAGSFKNLVRNIHILECLDTDTVHDGDNPFHRSGYRADKKAT